MRIKQRVRFIMYLQGCFDFPLCVGFPRREDICNFELLS